MWRHAAPPYGFECRDRNGRVGERRAQLKGMGWTARDRACGDREAGVRRGPAVGGRPCPAVPIPPGPVRPLCPTLPELRPRAGPAALAGAGPGRGACGARGRCAAGALSRARGGRRRGALGPARRRTHPGLRRSGRLAGGAVLEDRGHRTDADRLADRGRGRHPGVGRHRGQRGSPRRAAPDRHRRDQLQEGPPLFDGRR
jgi:hypothetical protein